MKTPSRPVFFLILAACTAAVLAWNFPLSRDMVYRYRHGLAAGAKSVTVNFVKDGERVRSAVFFYDRGEGRGPASQDHSVRLSPGKYDAVFVFEYSDGRRVETSVPVGITRTRYSYTFDVEVK
jgi:hypothetical protein